MQYIGAKSRFIVDRSKYIIQKVLVQAGDIKIVSKHRKYRYIF